MLVGNFKRTLMRYPDPVLWACLEIFFTPKRCQLLNNTFLQPFFLRPSTLKGTAEDSILGLLEAEHSKKYQNRFLTPENYHEHPSLYMGVAEMRAKGANICFLQAFLLFDDLVKILSDKIPGKKPSINVRTNS